MPAREAEPELTPLPNPLAIGPEVKAFEPRLSAPHTPYRPDTVVDGGEAHGFVVRAASVRGRDKRADGGPREDDFCIVSIEERDALVISVADGMGAAQRGHLGAALAVRYAAERLTEALADAPPAELDWSKLFDIVVYGLIEQHKRDNESPQATMRDVSRDLGTTLTVAVAERQPTGTVAVHVAAAGDSPAWRLHNGNYELLVGERETDEDTFSTTSVVALPYTDGLRVGSTELDDHDVLLIGTDGFGGPLDNGNNEVGRAFARYLSVPPPISLWGYLVDFTRSTYSDDRTLVAVWPPPRDGAPVAQNS
jgi:protein phosphatase 2C-like protein